MKLQNMQSHDFKDTYQSFRGVSSCELKSCGMPDETAQCKILQEKIWSEINTNLLINLVQQYDDKFQRSVKKNIWQKIANQLNQVSNISVTWLQCDTKWKGLQKTYKEVLKHNNTSGKNRKTWLYFDRMHEILYEKPEINAVATCNSISGSITKKQEDNDVEIDNSTEPSIEKMDKKFESKFNQKRKHKDNQIERRHQEKLARLDRFLNTFDKMVDVLEKNNEK